MFSKELEQIIDAALADGVLSPQERAVLHKRAVAEGVDPDELDVVIEGRLAKMKKSENRAKPASPKSVQNEKPGNVVKCPNCGSTVPEGSAVCKKCGYTFQNVKANSSIEKLQEKLERLILHEADVKEKMYIISNFPVPNTRADLLEFLAFLKMKSNAVGPRDGGSSENDFSYAYWQLFSSCVQKAKISFANDQDFIPFFNKYEEERKKTKSLLGLWSYVSGDSKEVLIVICVFFLLFLIAHFLGI